VKLTSNATITCRQQASNLNVAWNFVPPNSTHASVLFPSEHYSFLQGDGQTLLIVNVTAADAGKYFCERLNWPSCITDYSTLTIFSKLPSHTCSYACDCGTCLERPVHVICGNSIVKIVYNY